MSTAAPFSEGPPGDGLFSEGPAALAPVTDGEIYERILEAVLDHRLAPGTKLVEERLGEAFGVSRTRIRPVLARLASEQIVVLTPNRGASIASPTAEEAHEVFAARALIEPTLVEGFIAHATEADLRALTRVIEEEDAALVRHDRRSAIRLSGEFHLQIAERAGNRTLEKILRELVSRTSLILMTFERREHQGGCGDEHRGLVEAIAARDATLAKRLMRKHLGHIEAHLDFRPAAPVRVALTQLLAR
ncbi:GntR family transcriptional regulator [Niveibacterium sp. SC-1]|uniref:GntR family transcriptional regulator n=1 Tax=Niveibacterium sp. SC-1 TaxID=3135646 RepID=UPI00312026CE